MISTKNSEPRPKYQDRQQNDVNHDSDSLPIGLKKAMYLGTEVIYWGIPFIREIDCMMGGSS